MRTALTAALFAAALGGCAAIPSEPVRIVDSRADVAACRSLGTMGPPVRTDSVGAIAGDANHTPYVAGEFGERLQAMRAAANEQGATDLLLVRRPYRDWSFVQGIAYRCRR